MVDWIRSSIRSFRRAHGVVVFQSGVLELMVRRFEITAVRLCDRSVWIDFRSCDLAFDEELDGSITVLACYRIHCVVRRDLVWVLDLRIDKGVLRDGTNPLTPNNGGTT